MLLNRKTQQNYFFYLTLSIGMLLSFSVFLFLFYLTKSGGDFFLKFKMSETLFFDKWFPSENLFGLAPMIIGSFLISAFSLLIAGPASLLLAFFYFYIAPKKIKSLLVTLIDVFLSIPSVVFGFWGLIVLVPLIGQYVPPGQSIFAASLVLSLMIIPIGFKTFVTSFKTVPADWLHAAKSCNLKPLTVFKDIIFKNLYKKFFISFLLQATRAIGETMAVLMVCGNIVSLPNSLFSPIRTLTTNIALEMAYAMGQHRLSLYFCGLLLMAFVMALLLISARFKDVENE